jgi:hypothetical protein
MGTLCNFPQPRYWTLGLLPQVKGGWDSVNVIGPMRIESLGFRCGNDFVDSGKLVIFHSVSLTSSGGAYFAAVCEGDFTQRKPR